MTEREKRAPVEYSPQLWLEICLQLGEGVALKAICRKPGMPHYTTAHRWILTIPEAKEQYDVALKIRGQALADDTLELADTPPEYSTDKRGTRRVDMGWVHWLKNRVDTRKWLASKLYVSVYGDRVTAEISGKDGGPIATRDETPGIGAVKAALASIFMRAQQSPQPSEGTGS